jgi:hypothetical protein
MLEAEVLAVDTVFGALLFVYLLARQNTTENR